MMMMMMMGRASEGSKLLYSSLQNTKLVLLCYPIFKTEIFYYSFKKKLWDATFGKDIGKEIEKWAEILLYSASTNLTGVIATNLEFLMCF